MTVNRDHITYIKSLFDVCENASERRQVFMMFAQDLTYNRGDICQAMKECNLDDNFDIKPNMRCSNAI